MAGASISDKSRLFELVPERVHQCHETSTSQAGILLSRAVGELLTRSQAATLSGRTHFKGH